MAHALAQCLSKFTIVLQLKTAHTLVMLTKSVRASREDTVSFLQCIAFCIDGHVDC